MATCIKFNYITKYTISDFLVMSHSITKDTQFLTGQITLSKIKDNH